LSPSNQNGLDLYHIARPDPSRWDAMEYWDDTSGKGIVFAFRSDHASESRQVFKLKGLDPRARYELSTQDGSVERTESSGQDLMTEGVGLELRAQGTSELIF